METINIVDVLNISLEAGRKILEVYKSEDLAIEKKEDESPLTIADRKSHELISQALTKLYPAIPILSEEGRAIDYSERKDWELLWVVDPLDGTKEFIKKNGEFTINIALVQNDTPILGVIYAPVLDTVYFATETSGSYKLSDCQSSLFGVKTADELLKKALKLPLVEQSHSFTVVASRSHMSAETEEYITSLKALVDQVDVISAGSSLKLCLVAEGKADAYPRFAYTMEWDTAAGQAIIEGAGGQVLLTNEKEPLVYNKENLRNPWFIAKG